MKFQMAKLIFNPGGVTPSVNVGSLGPVDSKVEKGSLNSMSAQKKGCKIDFSPLISENGV